MKSSILIVVRLGSTRLAQKPLLPLGDRRVIDQLIARLRQARRADGIVLCTTTSPVDDPLASVAAEHSVPLFRGSEANVPARLLAAAQAYGVEFCLIAEGDEIFIDPSQIDRMISLAQQQRDVDFMALEGFPIGTYVLGFRTAALERVCQALGTGDDINTDGWGRYFTQTGWFKTLTLRPETAALQRPDYRFTLDYPEDYALAQAVYARLYQPGQVVPLGEAVALLDREPALVDINRQRVEEYRTHVSHYPPLNWNGRSL
jgi:spore coat polysaccharide biosynthesis protein SpsF